MLYFINLAAIAEEKKRQREGLIKQRDQYISRSEKMKRELKALREQKGQLMDGLGKRSPSPKTNGFVKENEKLQVIKIIQGLNAKSAARFCVSFYST